MSGITLSVKIDAEALQEAIIESSCFDAMESILAMDLAIADAGFTEELIKRLAASLRNDMTAGEYEVLIAELAKAGQP